MSIHRAYPLHTRLEIFECICDARTSNPRKHGESLLNSDQKLQVVRLGAGEGVRANPRFCEFVWRLFTRAKRRHAARLVGISQLAAQRLIGPGTIGFAIAVVWSTVLSKAAIARCCQPSPARGMRKSRRGTSVCRDAQARSACQLAAPPWPLLHALATKSLRFVMNYALSPQHPGE